MKERIVASLLAAAWWSVACGGTLEPEPASAELEIGSVRQALDNGGLGAETCPGGGSPQCVACVDAECVYACAGGSTCTTDSWPEPGGTASLCSVSSNCRTFAFGGGALALGGGLSLQRATAR